MISQAQTDNPMVAEFNKTFSIRESEQSFGGQWNGIWSQYRTKFSKKTIKSFIIFHHKEWYCLYECGQEKELSIGR